VKNQCQFFGHLPDWADLPYATYSQLISTDFLHTLTHFSLWLQISKWGFSLWKLTVQKTQLAGIIDKEGETTRSPGWYWTWWLCCAKCYRDRKHPDLTLFWVAIETCQSHLANLEDSKGRCKRAKCWTAISSDETHVTNIDPVLLILKLVVGFWVAGSTVETHIGKGACAPHKFWSCCCS